MRISILGAGAIGAELARRFSKAGHFVRLANARSPESLVDIVRGTAIKAVEKEDAG